MAFEEKRAWMMALVAVGGYAAYLVVVLGRAEQAPLVEVPYAGALLWAVGGAVLASFVLHLVIAVVAPDGANEKDRRDQQIHRWGEQVGQWFVVLGAVLALAMALADWHRFWIANVLYLGFVLAAVVASVTKVLAYRRGLPSW